MRYPERRMDQLIEDSERLMERRKFYDPNLESLLEPDCGRLRVRTILEQVKEGRLDIGAAESELVNMLVETASTDQKTGLYLGEAVRIKLARLIEHSQETGIPLTVVYLDGDNFREINNQLDHATGDKAISVIADALRETTRETDIQARLNEEGKQKHPVNREKSQARMGGDEFLIVLPGTTEEQANTVINRFRGNLLRLAELHIPEYQTTFGSPMTVSVGVAQYKPDLDSTPLALITRAETAMKQSKQKNSKLVTV